jgi:hypothetical protein
VASGSSGRWKAEFKVAPVTGSHHIMRHPGWARHDDPGTPKLRRCRGNTPRDSLRIDMTIDELQRLL